MFDILHEIWGSIQRNKLRTIATGFAVSSGIFLLIVLLGAGNGVIHTLENNATSVASDIVEIFPGWTSLAYNGYKEGRSIQLDERDETSAKEIAAEHVLSTSPQVTQSSLTAIGKEKKMTVSLEGVTPTYLTERGRELLEGRFINALDIQDRRKNIVMDDEEAEKLFNTKKGVVGQELRIGNSIYHVVGLVKSENNNMSSELYAPYSTVQTIYQKGKQVDAFNVKVDLKTTQQYNQFQSSLLRKISRTHNFDPEDKSAVFISSGKDVQETLSTASAAIHTAFLFMGLLTLLSGVTGVSNIMLIAVKERTHEFGIQRALGATPWQVIKMVVLESILITTLFGYIGMFAGILFCQYMDASAGNQVLDLGEGTGLQMTYFQDPTVDLSICIEATAIMVIAGAVAGFFPARKASHVKPVEALRSN